MTTGPGSQCLIACAHLRDGDLDAPITCDAFPQGIPDAILDNEVDHRQPVDGDHGIQFQAKPGTTYPEYALP